MNPDLPGHERRHDRRLERHLDEDQPGAPPGFLIDDEDDRTGSHIIGDRTGCAEEVPRDRWDPDDRTNLLARGRGEHDLEEA